jgi:cell division protein ZapA
MGQITFVFAGRNYTLSCRDGEELHFERLGRRLGRHAETAARAAGGNAERTLLYMGLLLADEVDEAERNPAKGLSPVALEMLAEKLEAVAATLEDDSTIA